MFFTRVGTIIAYIGFGLGIIRTAMGFYIPQMADSMSSNTAGAQRYLGSKSPGEVIDQGIVWILVAVALGTLCEISRSRTG